MHPKDEAGMANHVDTDQTGPGAVQSGSTLFVLSGLSVQMLRPKKNVCVFQVSG